MDYSSSPAKTPASTGTRVSQLDLARFYADRGWAVLPLHTVRMRACSCAAGPACARPGMHPIDGLDAAAATTDHTAITAWWGATPEANIGIATEGDAAHAFLAKRLGVPPERVTKEQASKLLDALSEAERANGAGDAAE